MKKRIFRPANPDPKSSMSHWEWTKDEGLMVVYKGGSVRWKSVYTIRQLLGKGKPEGDIIEENERITFRAGEYVKALAERYRVGSYLQTPLPVWHVRSYWDEKACRSGQEAVRVRITRLRRAEDLPGYGPDYADTAEGHTVTTHYIFPRKPVLRLQKDQYGEFSDWACDEKGELA